MKNALALLLLVVTDGLCQTQDRPDTLQTLLSEVHQLRQAIETMTAASQRLQIALYGLQMQDAAVARETLRFDTVHDKCVEREAGRQKLASDIQKLESDLTAGSVPQQEATQLQSVLAERKRQLESTSTEVQSCQSTEAEALSQLHKEQATLADLQERIQRLDKALEKTAGADK